MEVWVVRRDAKVNSLFGTIVNSILEEFSQGCSSSSFPPPPAFPPDCSFFFVSLFLRGGCLGFHARGKTVSPAPSKHSTRTRVWHKKREMEDRAAFSVTSFFRAVRQKKEGGKGEMWPLSCMDEGFSMLGRIRRGLFRVLYAGKFVKSTSVTLTDPIYF